MSPRRRSLAHAGRLAAFKALAVLALYATAAAAVDVIVAHRLSGSLERRITERLESPVPPTATTAIRSHDVDLDDVPVIVWRVAPDGRVTTAPAGAPGLPRRRWDGSFVDISSGGRTFRLTARPVPGGGWTVAGASTAEYSHSLRVLLAAELLVVPLVALLAYGGALFIARRGAAPAEEARRRQLEFTSDASHELRTPVSVIQAETSLALAGTRSAGSYRGTLTRIQAETGRLQHIIEDLLWLARFEAVPPGPAAGPVDLAALTTGAAGRFRPVAEAKGLDLVIDVGGRPAWMTGPAPWLERLVGVLVDNACRYTPAGGRVSVSVSAQARRVRLVVADTGPGIPEGEEERLFDRFHRATDEAGGAGLGLAIADSVVRATHGTWSVGRGPEGGAVMEVAWPRVSAPVDVDDLQQAADGQEKAAHQDGDPVGRGPGGPSLLGARPGAYGDEQRADGADHEADLADTAGGGRADGDEQSMTHGRSG